MLKFSKICLPQAIYVYINKQVILNAVVQVLFDFDHSNYWTKWPFGSEKNNENRANKTCLAKKTTFFRFIKIFKTLVFYLILNIKAKKQKYIPTIRAKIRLNTRTNPQSGRERSANSVRPIRDANDTWILQFQKGHSECFQQVLAPPDSNFLAIDTVLTPYKD